MKRFDAINIIGFNAPEWYIAYFGSVFAQCIPVGIYNTNSANVCEFIVKHS
jgi:long-chain-fatty-acid--CoA ligase ACSBG